MRSPSVTSRRLAVVRATSSRVATREPSRTGLAGHPIEASVCGTGLSSLDRPGEHAQRGANAKSSLAPALARHEVSLPEECPTYPAKGDTSAPWCEISGGMEPRSTGNFVPCRRIGEHALDIVTGREVRRGPSTVTDHGDVTATRRQPTETT